MNGPVALSYLGAFLLRCLAATLRIEFQDDAGIQTRLMNQPLIWCIWHNRMLLATIVRARYFRNRKSVVLTSPSKDGTILSLFLIRFGVESVRGSSSRRGATALVELLRKVRAGYDVGITPDGPRGPRYTIAPGIIALAQKSGAPVMPVHIFYSSRYQFRSWDKFMIPYPFSKVRVVFDRAQVIEPETDPEEARLALEKTMLAQVGDD